MSDQIILALVGPSGVGKTTICRYLASTLDGELREVVSTTTRPPRVDEKHGQDYIFLDRTQAEKYLEDGEFLEHVEYDGNLYGFLRSSFENPLEANKNLIVVVERHGLKQIKKAYGDQVFSILIVPPSMEELETRLREDGRDESSIQRRLSKAQKEMHEERELFDAVLVNDELVDTLENAVTLYKAFCLIRKGCE